MKSTSSLNRRELLGATAAGAAVLAAGNLLGQQAGQPAAPPQTFEKKIKVGIVGCGGRGSWIANLFKQHGGYEFVGAADYFVERAQKTGTALGADASKCFGGLSAYKKLIESGVEAVILETPPYFFPEHAEAAVQAGKHVYMAKPVAVDVPGTLKIGAAGKAAAQKKQVFLVDYQMPTDPFNIEAAKIFREGGLGKLQMIFTAGKVGGDGFRDPPAGETIESRLTGLTWVNDDAMGCGYLGNYDIHIIDAIIWATGKVPVSAYGRGGRYRKDPHGDSYDTNFVTYVMPDGLTWIHESAISTTHEWIKQGSLEGSLQGEVATAHLAYWGKAYVRGGPKHTGGGAVEKLYDNGAKRNIAAFYDNVMKGVCGNETAQRSVDCTLACILGREAAKRGEVLTMEQIVKENKRLEVDLKGLKA